MLVEPALNGFENVLMFPSADPSFLAGGASGLDCTSSGRRWSSSGATPNCFPRSCSGRRASRRQDKRKCPRQPRSKSCLPKRPSAFAFEVIGFGSVTVIPASSHGPNLFAVEVTAVGDGIELLHAQRRLGLVGHMGELRSVSPVVGYLMHNDQMMVGLDGNLNVVADDTGTAAAGGHRAGIGIGQRYLLVRGSEHLHLEKLETPHLLLQRLDLLFEAVRLGLQRL